VLDVLRKEGVTDVAVVVTRYFGGILLGTGGLVRAYSQAAKMALDAAGKSTMEKLLVFSLRVNYSDLQKIEPILENYTMIRLDTAYADDVRLSAAMREGEYPALEKALTERTNGRAILKLEGEQFACL
jgi:putative IMPACT (imprinted ancient) family translation regulator